MSNFLLNDPNSSGFSSFSLSALSVLLSDLSVFSEEAVEDVDFSLTNSVEVFSSTVFAFFEAFFVGGLIITSSSGPVLKD